MSTKKPILAWILVLLLSAVAVAVAVAETPQKKKRKRKQKAGPPPMFAEPDGRRLRDIAPIDGFFDRTFPMLVGGTSHAKQWGTKSETILNREFGFVTPANDFKQSGIHPEPGVWKWTKPDEWVQRCKAQKQLLRLHGPISPQHSKWVAADDRTAEELSTILDEFMTELCKRYNDEKHIQWMDVVNETVTREGEWFGPKEGVEKWENPWTKIGFDESDPLKPPLYIEQAFRIANKFAPNIKQLINQHGDMEQPMWRKVCATVVHLKQKGIRVDGIGWQAHVVAGFEKDPENIKNLNALIAWTHKQGLEFHVTENTVWPKGDYEGDLEAQAETFRAIVKVLLSHCRNGVVSWNAWQMRDAETQRPERKLCMFDDDGQPKPAYYAVQAELEAFANTTSAQ
jgi:GH35 family endo-1,4-beta-xylanase